MIYYFPLEPYQERYTAQLSRADDGWMERNFKSAGVRYTRVGGVPLSEEIKVGSVLDAAGRGYFAMSQCMIFLKMLYAGIIDNGDILYFDDFWHPGVEAIKYAATLQKLELKYYSFLYAQSVDRYDFTTQMLPWIRHFEKGNGAIMDGIFVTCPVLRSLVFKAKIAPAEKVHVVGLPFSSEEVASQFSPEPVERKKQVVFSSRWDKEKDPAFFISLMRYLISIDNEINFVVTTSSSQIRSNDHRLITMLELCKRQFPDRLEIKVNQTKAEYYQTLRESKVQFNCADQDWVSFTLLEAIVAGCFPVYPNFRSFPHFFGEESTLFTYKKGSIGNAAEVILRGINVSGDGWKAGREFLNRRVASFDRSIQRMLRVMGFDSKSTYDPLY